MLFIYMFFIHITFINSLPVANILNANYATGVSFSKINYTTSSACMCSCYNHPHCLSVSVTKISSSDIGILIGVPGISSDIYYCQLFATYPIKTSQLSSSSTSNVTIYTARALSSVYINNGTSLTNPTNLFVNTANSWLPVFKLFTGNNQSFLWINSSNSTTLTTIPKISINQISPHWFSILISQWNKNLYTPIQVAVAVIVNRTIIFDFLIFNVTQSDIVSWFSLTSLTSTEFWSIIQYRNQQAGVFQMKAVYSDSDCIRSFNTNYKGSTSGCSADFYGFLFVYGGYKDSCIAAVRNMSQVPIPAVYYAPTTSATNGNLTCFSIADGIMIFVR